MRILTEISNRQFEFIYLYRRCTRFFAGYVSAHIFLFFAAHQKNNRVWDRWDAIRRSERGRSLVRRPCLDDLPEFCVLGRVFNWDAVVEEILQSAGEHCVKQ